MKAKSGQYDFQSALADGWANFRWNSAAGAGVVIATSVTVLSWIAIGYLVYKEMFLPPPLPEARSYEGAKWLREACPGHEVGEISEISIYPVKSGAQLLLQESNILTTGFEGDRTCMVITANDNNFYTQRDNPKMALLNAKYDSEGGLILYTAGDSPKKEMKIILTQSGEAKTATVWDDPFPVIDQGDAAADFISEIVDREVRLENV